MMNDKSAFRPASNFPPNPCVSQSCSIQHTKWQIAIFLYLLTYLPAMAQTVVNVRTSFDQSNQLMLIYYDLKGLNYKKEIMITPQIVSGDASLTLVKSLSGDFGWRNRGGKNKLIIWDNFKDGVNGLDEVKIELKTELRDAVIPRFWSLALHGSNSAPFGVKIANLSPIGFFAGFRVGRLAPPYRYTASDTGVMDYFESGVYEIGSERRLASYAITAGPVFQLTRNVYAYAGPGYGAEQVFWKYQSFNLKMEPIGSYWALNKNINRKGLTADGGAVVRIGRLVIDLGVSTIRFKSFQIIGGVGISLSKN